MGPRQRQRQLHRYRGGVLRLVGMEVTSGVGDGIFWVGLAATLIDRGVGPDGFALAALARLGPRALVSAPAGVLADRVDRRRLLVGLDVGRAASMFALAALTAVDAGPGLLLVLVLVAYTLAAPYRPALTAALPLIAGEAGLSAANALLATVRQVMTFVGPVVGAIVLVLSTTTVAFCLNAASFLVAAVLMASITELAGRPGGRLRGIGSHRADWLRELAEGWREVTATAGLSIVTILVFTMYSARGAELVLYVLVAEERLGLGAAGVGVLTGAVGLGAVCVLPLVARVSDDEWPALAMTIAVASTGVPLVLLATLDSPVGACAALFVLGAGLVLFEVRSVVLLQRLTRREVLGRVFGLVGTASNAGKLFGALAAPVLVSSMGLAGALATSGVVVAVVGAAAVPGLVSLARTTTYRKEQLRPIVEVLATLGLFTGASRAALERVAASIVEEPVEVGTVVVRQGDPADDLFVIRHGTFGVTVDKREVNTIAVGEWFGEIGLLQRRPRTATVAAETDAVVWRIPGQTFLAELQGIASEPTALFDVMADRLAALTEAPSL